MIIAIMVDMFGTLLTGLGLRSTDPNKKYKYYRVAIYALIVASKYYDKGYAYNANSVKICIKK